MEYLVAADLEGVGGVVGAPNETLTASPDYELAKENAIKEINIAVKALFDSGADKVAVWDNHGGGGNLDFSKIDSRVEKITVPKGEHRFEFARKHNFSGIVYIGYHSREGTFGGVLAHTYSSKTVQYAKINGEEVGELEVDTYIAATHNIAPLLVASDEACVNQFKATSPETVFVITKYGKSRNSAEFRDEDEVLREIYSGVIKALKKDIKPVSIKAPLELEVRYSRAERSEEIYRIAEADDGIGWVKYGSDTHTLIFGINELNRMPSIIN